MADILRSTDRKLAAVLEKIDAVAELKFPHRGPEEALGQIRGVFTNLRSEVQSNAAASPSIQRTFCRRAVENLDTYLPIIGFIARAADLDGPVELHGPLLDLTEKALGDRSKLIMASEWDYSPLTILFPDLSKLGYVLVGLPGCEANNALLTPLSGHELGHNIWEAFSLEKALLDDTKNAIVQTILKEPTLAGFIPENIRKDERLLRDLDGEMRWYQCWQWLMRQCEEAFCDVIGLLIFREAFLHATEYLLTPTLTDNRNYDYPSSKNRVATLVHTAVNESPKIPVPDKYADMFDDEKLDTTDAEEAQVAVADKAFMLMIKSVYEKAKAIVQAKGLAQHSESEISRISGCFRMVVPATGLKSLSDIVNAGWRVHFEGGEFLTKSYPRAKPEDAPLILNELILKTIEVFEIERRSPQS